MTIGRFDTGGYYLHKVTGYWKGNASAWFDSDGCLLDAEQILEPFGRVKSVKRDGPMWTELQRIGKRHRAA